MAIQIINCVAEHTETFLSAPSDSDIIVTGSRLTHGKTFFDLYEPRNLASIGLPETVPRQDLEDLIGAMKKQPPTSPEEAQKLVKASSLGAWLGSMEKIIAVGNGLFTLIKTGSDALK